MGNNHDKTNNKQTGGTRATRKNIYKVAKNNKMNGGGFIETFLGGNPTENETPIVTGTPVETPDKETSVVTPDKETSVVTPVETPDEETSVDVTPDANKEKEETLFGSIQNSVGQIFDADTDANKEEAVEEEEEEPVKSPLDTNQILLRIADLTSEIVKLQKILLGEIVEQPVEEQGPVYEEPNTGTMNVSELDSSSTAEYQPNTGTMNVSDLEVTPEQESVVESSIGLGETDGEETGEDGDSLGQSVDLNDTAGTMNINELKVSIISCNIS